MQLARPGFALACLFTLLGLACRSPLNLQSGTWVRAMQAPVDGQQLGYVLEVPAAQAPEAGWPLLLFLHGAGERGDDLAQVYDHGPLKLAGEMPELKRCVLVAPQCPEGQWWRPQALRALLDEVLESADVDPARLYVSGLSMGGCGTWALLSRYPELFAAAIPICGAGDTARLWRGVEGGFDLDGLLRARDVPIHAFHGELDSVIPVEESRVLVRALRESGGKVELTVYAGVAHDSWTQTYANPDVYTWLFAQRRGR